VTIWNFLLSVCMFAPFSGAMVKAHDAHASLPAYALAGFIGLILGAAFAWLMWFLSRRVIETTLALTSENRKTWYLRALLGAQVAWIVIALTVGLRLVPKLIAAVG
jgi:hypothetical protein